MNWGVLGFGGEDGLAEDAGEGGEGFGGGGLRGFGEGVEACELVKGAFEAAVLLEGGGGALGGLGPTGGFKEGAEGVGRGGVGLGRGGGELGGAGGAVQVAKVAKERGEGGAALAAVEKLEGAVEGEFGTEEAALAEFVRVELGGCGERGGWGEEG